MQYGIPRLRQSRRDIGPVLRDGAPRRRVLLAAELNVQLARSGAMLITRRRYLAPRLNTIGLSSSNPFTVIRLA